LVNNKPSLFTIPLSKSSSFSQINEICVHPLLYNKWLKKIINTINHSYKKSPYFNDVFPIIENTFDYCPENIADLAGTSIQAISNYLGLNKKFSYSSKRFDHTKGLDRVVRLVSIVKELEGNVYINASGGKSLYKKDIFKENAIHLNFLEGSIVPYKQFNSEFVAGLSIIDVLMFNSPEEINVMLDQYELV
jgi:hypothetical protein